MICKMLSYIPLKISPGCSGNCFSFASHFYLDSPRKASMDTAMNFMRNAFGESFENSFTDFFENSSSEPFNTWYIQISSRNFSNNFLRKSFQIISKITTWIFNKFLNNFLLTIFYRFLKNYFESSFLYSTQDSFRNFCSSFFRMVFQVFFWETPLGSLSLSHIWQARMLIEYAA